MNRCCGSLCSHRLLGATLAATDFEIRLSVTDKTRSLISYNRRSQCDKLHALRGNGLFVVRQISSRNGLYRRTEHPLHFLLQEYSRPAALQVAPAAKVLTKESIYNVDFSSLPSHGPPAPNKHLTNPGRTIFCSTESTEYSAQLSSHS